ncbi:BUD13 homolog [Acanthaster planci]|uniref:BUD13 homolog n=1 Tax=Acanthaster planci TaxID=133434 RepID=A0A8B7YWC8_ACAPL|nr:BUD13 homolog [Acanthaster planci]
MALPLDQREYLKRYLSAEPEDLKKKKRRKKVKTAVKVTRTFTIVDDDVDFRTLAPASEKQDEISNPLIADETPVVADVVDERPRDQVILEEYRTSRKWKTMGDDDLARKSRDANKRGRSRRDTSDLDLSPDRSSTSKSKPVRRAHEGGGLGHLKGQSRSKARQDGSDSDQSPPRQGRNRNGDQRGDRPSGKPVKHDSDSDLSPPRGGHDRRGGRPSGRPVRHDSDSDLSPPRGGHNRRGDRPSGKPVRHDSDSDLSPSRGGHDRRGGRPSGRPVRHDSESDLSPTRGGHDRSGGRPSSQPARHNSDSDLSPQRAGHDRRGDRPPGRPARHDSDSDLSPPRKRQEKGGKISSGKPARHDSDSDLSPPRKGQDRRGDTRSDRSSARPTRHNSDSDLSPPRRRQSRKDDRTTRHDSDSDLSPPRQRQRSDRNSDISPVRRVAPGRGKELPGPRISVGRGEHMRPEKTLTGTTAGLSDAKSMRRENEESRRRDAEMYAKLGDDVSGKSAKTVFRDKSGRVRDLETEKRRKREEDAKKAEEDQKFVEWGKGVAQTARQREFIKDALHEMDKPLARYRDDQDLDDMLKGVEREGDPMMAFLKKKQTKKQAAMGVKAKPKYQGPPPPPNRFNIAPGYRWDGVDRSNGFEKKFFLRQAEKRASKEMAYKWSTEDM